jgi:hypothetical protein
LPGRRGARRVVAGALVVAVMGVACGGASSETAARPTPPFTAEGTLLVAAFGFQTRLSSYPLPSGPISEYAQPVEGGFFQNFRGAFPGPDGSAYVLLQVAFGPLGASQLFRLGASRSVGLGGTVNIPYGGTLDVRGDHAIAWGCAGKHRSIFAFDLPDGAEWTPVAQGCSAALSPDGKAVAYVNGGSLFRKTLPDGQPERLLDLRSVAALREAGITRFPDGQGSIAWGPGGIGVTVGNKLTWAVVAYRSGHQPTVVPLGRAAPDAMAWQPTGGLLAFNDFVTTTQTGELRVLDPATGAITLVAVTQNYGQFQWSPDGRILAVARSGQLVSFVDLRGIALRTMSLGGVPVGWTS